ncbi:hypothetical protein [Streptomyces albidochromogenes]|uniref:Uncharacterized protein n=1 Tax=Streptomyces albidochromogenes TaxID=329524 RepID=A0ABW6FH82_9ACTN
MSCQLFLREAEPLVLDCVRRLAAPHGAHPDLPSDTTETLWVGMHLASARGRAAYEKWPEPWAPPFDTARCWAFVAATARDSLTRLRTD